MTPCLNNGWPSDSTFAFTLRTLESITLEEIFYGEFRTLSYLHSCYNPFSFVKQIIQGLSHKVHQILRYHLWVIVSKGHYNNVYLIINYYKFHYETPWLLQVSTS